MSKYQKPQKTPQNAAKRLLEALPRQSLEGFPASAGILTWLEAQTQTQLVKMLAIWLGFQNGIENEIRNEIRNEVKTGIGARSPFKIKNEIRFRIE